MKQIKETNQQKKTKTIIIIKLISTILLFIASYILLNQVGNLLVDQFVFMRIDRIYLINILLMVFVVMKFGFTFLSYKTVRFITDKKEKQRMEKYYFITQILIWLFSVSILFDSLKIVIENEVFIEYMHIPIIYYAIILGAIPIIQLVIDLNHKRKI